MEKCSNCERTIGAEETPYIHHDAVVCKECFESLGGIQPPQGKPRRLRRARMIVVAVIALFAIVLVWAFYPSNGNIAGRAWYSGSPLRGQAVYLLRRRDLTAAEYTLSSSVLPRLISRLHAIVAADALAYHKAQAAYNEAAAPYRAARDKAQAPYHAARDKDAVDLLNRAHYLAKLAKNGLRTRHPGAFFVKVTDMAAFPSHFTSIYSSYLRSALAKTARTTTGFHGRFAFKNISAGRYFLMCNASEAFWLAPVVVTANATATAYLSSKNVFPPSQ